MGDAPCTFLGSSETDFIKIAGVTIPFMVKCGKIYFDVFPAFTLMGQLQVALKSEWREIDSMLVGQGWFFAFSIKTYSVFGLDLIMLLVTYIIFFKG